MSETQNHDPVLTLAGMPTLAVGEIEYGLFFAVASIKAYAERKNMPFSQMVSDGWKAQDLELDEIKFLLLEALSGAERRRQVFCPGPPRRIDNDLVENILTIYHLADIWTVLIEAWNGTPGSPRDPLTPAQLDRNGQPSSD
ncbi:MAG: hypothetical protein JW990_09730 [Thermoleophilia bacterium]|nr:hypothetical protein [Thermoleophilia bacterium]